jgi:hypothetical protein
LQLRMICNKSAMVNATRWQERVLFVGRLEEFNYE